MTIADIARRAAKLAIDNSPTILTSFGVVGAISTAYLAAKASFEASDIIRLKEGIEYNSEEDRRENREVLKDRARLVWRLYVPAATMGVATITCIVGANHIGSRRAASLAAAFSITEKTFEEYKSKVVEKIGERKEEALRDEIIQDRVTANWDDSVEIHGKPDGEVFYDKYSDRYVWNTTEGVRSAMNDLNQSIIHNGYATAADFYHILEMPAPAWSYEVGWSSDNLLQLRFSAALTPSGKPVNAFEFHVEPIRDYARFH